jgi:hypothetical protein
MADGWGRGEPIIYAIHSYHTNQGQFKSSVSLKPVTNIGDAAKSIIRTTSFSLMKKV